MRTIIINTEIEFETQTCTCGGVYAINKDYLRRCRKEGGGWICPYCGGSWHYTETDLQKAQRLLEEEKEYSTKLANERQDALNEAAHFRKERDKILNRVENGVCPHCNRYFKNLHRHLQTKHKH